MKKLTLLLIAISLLSCGSIKKDKQTTEIKTEIDSSTKTIKESVLEGSKETKINYKANTFTFTPFDAGTPYFVDGKEYKGGTLTVKEETKDEFTLEQYKDKIFELSEQISKLKTEIEESKKHKETDNTTLFLGIAGIIALFLFLVVLVIIWYINKKTSL
jgi:hypothetical protein